MYLALLIIGVIMTAIGIVGMTSQHSSQNNQHTVSTTTQQPIHHQSPFGTQQQTETPSIRPTAGEQPEPQAAMSNKEKGNAFEGYVVDLLADRSTFTLLEWNQGATSSKGVHAENDKNPDLKVRHRFSDTFECTYWLECKYKSRPAEGPVTLNDYQLKRYRDIQRKSHIKVLLAIGTGGSPDEPANLYIVPLDSVQGSRIEQDKLTTFRLTEPRRQFASHIKAYFNEHVFKRRQ